VTARPIRYIRDFASSYHFHAVVGLCLSLTLFVDANRINAQGQLNFTLVKGPNGKGLGKIRNMSQDPYGYMWFAGEGEGASCVYRYDGNRFLTFRHEDANPNSLGGVGINSVYADNSGVIWIGLNEGLDEFNPANGIFKHYRHVSNDPSSLGGGVGPNGPILRDRRGRLWLGTDHGLDQLDEKTGKFIHYRNEPGNPKSLSSNVIWTIYEDHQGVIWVGTGLPWFKKDPEDGGLNRLNDDGTFTRFMHDPNDPHTLINNKVAAIFEDSHGTFWVGTSGDGLHTMDRRTGKFDRHPYDPKKPDQLSRPPLRLHADNDKITFITEDSTGSIWIGTMYSGINRYNIDTKKITHLEHSYGFPDSTSWNISVSRDGVVWITTENANLFRADPFYKPIASISTIDEAVQFLEDKMGYLWVSTRGSGLFKFDQQLKLIQQFKHDPADSLSLPSNILGALFLNDDNSLWVATQAGIRVLNEGTGKFSLLPLSRNLAALDTIGATHIFQDDNGCIWVSTWGKGLFRYNRKDNSVKRFLNDPRDSTSITINEVGQVIRDRSGKIWAGTSNGLNRLDEGTGKFTHYLPGNFSVHIFEDPEGNIWAGTSGGLYRYERKGDRFASFCDRESDINTFSLSGVNQDSEKNLWFYSQSNIIKLDPATKQTFFYGSKYGIIPFSLAPWKGVFKNHKGQLLIPHGMGFYTFSPEQLPAKSDFKIIITEFSINNFPVLPGKRKLIEKPIEEISHLDLKYNQNNIAFNFAAIDYRAPEAIQYFTMLENYDNTWRELKGEKNSYYLNIPAGNYVYHVKAFDSDGTRGEQIITIHINPPWWQTWWAYCLYGILFVLCLLGFIRWRTRTLKKEKDVLEKRVAQRTLELQKEKEIVESTLVELRSTQAQLIQSEKMASLGELTAGIAHEIQNPLNFVNNFSDVNKELADELEQEMQKGNYDDAKTIAKDIRENEEKINHHGKRADAIVKGMLQHSRASSGQRELTDINALADEYLRLAYHGLRAKDKSFNAEIKTDFDNSIGKINIVPQDIGRVLLNLINNAFYSVDEKQKQNLNGYEPAITVTTANLHAKIQIRVKDNGNGIPQKILEKIFQPFFTTKPTGQGTGLGLSLAYDTIKAHGGEIKVKTKEGEGSEFIVQLPMT